MKKYLLGAVAIVIAVAFSSFTKQNYSTVFFRFTGSATSQADVENKALYIQDDDQGCLEIANAACQVLVNSADVTPTSPATLQNETSGITLAGTFNSTPGTWSIAIASGIAAAQNRN